MSRPTHASKLRRGPLLVGLAAAISMLVLSACMTSPGPSDLAMRLAEGGRSAEDKARDAGRKPAAVLEFLGVQEGMTAIDLIASGGYYTEVLSEAVGPKGRVYAQNIDFVLKMRDGMNDKALTARLADDRLPNVVRLDREIEALGLEPGSVDLAITALNFHDIVDGQGPERTAEFLTAVHEILAPDGVFGIIDHAGNAGADNKPLHRMQEAVAIDVVESAGFVVVATSDVLRNPDDDRSRSVFAEGLRGHTDRFVLKVKKASAD